MTQESQDHQRPLGAVERLFRLLDQDHATHFAMAEEVEGAINPSPLTRALAALASDNPHIPGLLEGLEDASHRASRTPVAA